MKNVSNTLTTVGALAAAVLAGSSASGTAVLEPPVDVQDLAGTAPVAQTKPAKKRGKGKGSPPAAPQPPRLPRHAGAGSWMPQPRRNSNCRWEPPPPSPPRRANTCVIPRSARKNARPPTSPPSETALAIGLGERAAGYGPIIRSVILRMVKGTFNLKSVQIQSVNSATIRAILSDATFKTKAITGARCASGRCQGARRQAPGQNRPGNQRHHAGNACGEHGEGPQVDQWWPQ